MQLQTPQDVYDRVRREIGKLARRHDMELTAPTPDDQATLETYLGDALSELAVETERYRDSVQLRTKQGQAWVDRPDFIHHIHVARIFSGGTAYDVDMVDGRSAAEWSRAPDADTGRPTHFGAYGERLYFWPKPDAVYLVDLLCTLNGKYGTGTGTQNQSQQTQTVTWYFFRPHQLYKKGTSGGGGGGTKSPVPPSLSDLVTQTPRELHKAVVAYVTAEWLYDLGEAELASRPEQRFYQHLRDYDQEPVEPSTAERDYNPHGF